METKTDLVRQLTPFFVKRTEFAGMDRALFYAYDAAGDIDISSGWTDITLDTEVEESAEFIHAADSAEIEIDDDGTYEITYYITTYVSVGTSQSESRAKMQVDTGGGYADIPGTLSTMLNRDTSQGETNASVTFLKDLSDGDKIKLVAQRESGTNTILTLANGCGVVIRDALASGARGPAGVGAVIDATYVALSASAGLTNERILTAGDSISVTDAGAGSTVTIALTIPGTLTVATANSATAPHLHTVTSSSNPGAAASLLASDASGYLQLVGLGIGAAPGSADLHFGAGIGITHADGVAAGQFLRANGVRYVPDTLDVADITDLAYAVPNLTLGLANAAGVANTVIRTDATILAFDAVAPNMIECDDAAATGAATVAARRDHEHGIVCAVPVDIANANAEGAAASFARSNHEHNHPAGLGVDLHHSEVHVINSTGPHAEAGLTIGHVLRVSGAAAFSFAAMQAGDLPGIGGVPALTLGVANAAGVAATYVQTDASIAVFDATVPTTIAVGDTAATGSAGVGARRDHAHGITSSSNPGAAASILASAADGGLQLIRLGIGADPDTNNRITMVDGGQIGQTNGPLITFNDTLNYLGVMGCKVGIGTTDPTGNLHIEGTGTQVLKVESTDNSDVSIELVRSHTDYGDWEFRNSGGHLYIGAGNAELYDTKVTILDSGNVGFGTTAPQAKVETYSTTIVHDAISMRVNAGSANQEARLIWKHVTTYDSAVITSRPGSAYNSGDLRFYTSTNRVIHANADMIITSLGYAGFGTLAPDRLIHAEVSDAVTAAVTYAQRLSHITSGTAAAGFGTGIEFELEDAGGGMDVAATIQATWANAAAGSERGTLQLSTVSGGIIIEEGSGVTNVPSIRAGYSGNTITTGLRGAVISGGGFSGGSENSITAEWGTICGGYNNAISGFAATIVGGYSSVADKYGQVVNSTNRFAADGDCQATIQMVASRSVVHDDANWYELYLDGSVETIPIATNTVWTFHILLAGTTQGCAKSFGFEIVGVIENDGGTTSILASTVTTVYDGDDTDFDARVDADDVSDELLIEVQDSTSGGDTVRWIATIRMAEVTYPA